MGLHFLLLFLRYDILICVGIILSTVVSVSANKRIGKGSRKLKCFFCGHLDFWPFLSFLLKCSKTQTFGLSKFYQFVLIFLGVFNDFENYFLDIFFCLVRQWGPWSSWSSFLISIFVSCSSQRNVWWRVKFSFVYEKLTLDDI